ARIVEKLWQAEWRIGEIKRAIAAINEIVGAVEPLAFKFVRQHRQSAIGLEAHNATIPVLVYGEATFPIKRQPIRPGLTVLCNVRTFVTALFTKHRELSVSLRRIFVDGVVVWIAEKEIATFAVPNRPFSEFESFGQFEDLRIGRHDRIECRIFANDFDVYLAWSDGNRHYAAFVKLQLCFAHPDIVSRRTGKWAVGPKNRELNFLAGLYAAVYDQPIRRIPAFDYRSAALVECARDFSVHPDFGVIINRCLENSSRSREIDVVDALRNRDVDPIPVETKPAGRPACVECGRIALFPFRVVEISAASMRREVVSIDRFAGRLLIRASGLEIPRDNFGIAITPLTFDEVDSLPGREINHCVGLSSGCISICFSKCVACQEDQRAKGNHHDEAQAPHGGVHRSLAMFTIEFRCPGTEERCR